LYLREKTQGLKMRQKRGQQTYRGGDKGPVQRRGNPQGKSKEIGRTNTQARVRRGKKRKGHQDGLGFTFCCKRTKGELELVREAAKRSKITIPRWH